MRGSIFSMRAMGSHKSCEFPFFLGELERINTFLSKLYYKNSGASKPAVLV